MAEPDGSTPAPDDTPVGPNPSEQREAALASIDKSRRGIFADNGIIIDDDDDTPAPGSEESDAEDPPAAEADQGEPTGDALPEDSEPSDTPASDEPAEQMVVVKVDGVETEIPLSELRDSYQIRSAADNRLAQAQQILQNARDTAAAPAPAPDDAGAAPTPAPPHQEVRDPLADYDFTAAAQKIQFAEADEAGEALREMAQAVSAKRGNGADQPVVDQKALVQEAVDQIEFQNSVSQFATEYEDILSDPGLAAMAGQRLRQNLEAALTDSQSRGVPRPRFDDIFRATGDGIRTWVDGITSARAAPGPGDGGEDPREDDANANANAPGEPAVTISKETRDERKRRSSPPAAPRSGPSTGAPTGQPPQPPDEAANRSGAIQEMQKARGQAA